MNEIEAVIAMKKGDRSALPVFLFQYIIMTVLWRI